MVDAYTKPAKILHWLIAALIIGLLVMGLVMTGLEKGPDQIWVYGLHKSTGILVLMLVAARVAWRFTNPVPRLPKGVPPWVVYSAHAGHFGLYACMFAMPLTGWAMSSAAGFPVSFYGWFVLPDIVSPNKELRLFMRGAHEWVAYGLMALIAGHVAAALWHHFIRKDNVLRRMWFAALALAGAVALPVAYDARAEEALARFTPIPEKSRLTFVAMQNDAPVEGEFGAFTADILFSPEKPEESVITAEADIGSLRMANEEAAAELVKPEWFDAGAFPKATARIVNIKAVPAQPGSAQKHFYGDAELTIRDKTMTVPVNFVLERYDAEGALATGRIALKRTAFGVGQGQWRDTNAVRDIVTVKFRIEAKRVK